MTRFLAMLPALLCAILVAAVLPASRTEALMGGVLGLGEAALAAALLPRLLASSHQAFLKGFLIVFASQALVFGGLLLLAWKGCFAAAPLLGVYGAGAVGGTLVVGLRLKPKGAVGAR